MNHPIARRMLVVFWLGWQSALGTRAAVAETGSAADETTSAAALVQKIQSELSESYLPPEMQSDPHLPRGELIQGKFTDSAIYPGTENGFQVYVPAQYDPTRPGCLWVKLDGLGVPRSSLGGTAGRLSLRRGWLIAI